MTLKCITVKKKTCAKISTGILGHAKIMTEGIVHIIYTFPSLAK